MSQLNVAQPTTNLILLEKLYIKYIFFFILLPTQVKILQGKSASPLILYRKPGSTLFRLQNSEKYQKISAFSGSISICGLSYEKNTFVRAYNKDNNLIQQFLLRVSIVYMLLSVRILRGSSVWVFWAWCSSISQLFVNF